MSAPAHPSKPRTGKLALFLGLLAAVHVFIFTAAFPFYSVVDEQMHLDLVVHYSRLDIPREMAGADTNALPFMVVYASPEYLQITGETPPLPPWKQSMDAVRDQLMARTAWYQNNFQDHEASQPPLYYTLAGAWWRLGKLLGFDGLSLLYWLRFLNVPLIFAIAWLAGYAARKVFPENVFIQVAVPALLVVMPQSIFYALNNDILSPLAFGAAFLAVLKFWEAESPGPKLCAATGLALAASYLTKITNLPLLGVAIFFIALKILGLVFRGRLRPSLKPLFLLLLCTVVPIAAWMAWCQAHFGDLTGSGPKIKFLGWTDRPMSDWLHHPLFTSAGCWYFLKNNLATFWQGEALWHRQPLTDPAVNAAYAILSLGALALTLVAMVKPRSGFTAAQRPVLWFGFLCFFAMLAFFALLSVKYDFQDCFYPSREHPFFTSGRLMLGMLIPFLLLFAAGLDRLLASFQANTKFFILLLLLGYMLLTEISADQTVFASAYNWYNQ